MIKGIGVDICNMNRIHNLDLLAKKILHEKELEIYQQKKSIQAKKEFVGGRFAVKEAYFKACGVTSYQDICCLNDNDGKPYILNKSCHVSISHEKDYVIAFIVAE